MKKIFTVLILSLATSSAFAIPCTSEEISSALREYIDAQPICLSPCEAAKVYQNIYQHGLTLVTENCSAKNPEALIAIRDLNQALAEANESVRDLCH